MRSMAGTVILPSVLFSPGGGGTRKNPSFQDGAIPDGSSARSPPVSSRLRIPDASPASRRSGLAAVLELGELVDVLEDRVQVTRHAFELVLAEPQVGRFAILSTSSRFTVMANPSRATRTGRAASSCRCRRSRR
jgi:hypothetical protein